MGDTSDLKSVINSSEVSFPRGGATALTPLEVKEISNEATKDVLFETSNATKRTSNFKSEQPNKKSKKKVQKKTKKSSNDIEEDSNTVQIENFNFKNLIPGTSILGQITKIGKLDITLALGDNLSGFIPITSISEEITSQIERFEASEDELDEEISEDEETVGMKPDNSPKFPELKSSFRIGQWLKARVVKSNDDKKKRIQLTAEPELVNESLEDEDLITGNLIQCSVKSIEDHGVIVNTGKPEFSGFISNKEIKNANFNVEDIVTGSLILCSIINEPKNRTITLRPVESSSTSSKNAITSISSIDAVQPGILVNFTVTDVTKNGVIGRVFGLLDATINLAHLRKFDFQKLKHSYAIGNTVKARIIAVLLKGGTKKLIVSQLPDIISFSSKLNTEALEAFPIGYTFDNAKIEGTDPNYLFVSFGHSDIMGQVHNSRINLEKSLDIDYTVGTSHKARVIGFNQIDNLLVLSMEPNVIKSKYLSVHDMPAGELVDGVEIVKVLPESAGIIVKVLNFDAFVPSNHMSDIKLVYPERKFKTGNKVKGRVLKTEGKKLLITLKKSLVNMEDSEVLNSFEKATLGFKTSATVEKFVHNGVVVSFFGNMKAYLPKNEISETFVENAKDYLKIGQTVNAKILGIDEKEKRLVVSLRQSLDLSDSQRNTLSDLQPAKSIVEATVIEKKKDSVIVELKENDLRGVLFYGHLSDGNYEQNRALFKKLPIGEKIDVLVLEKDLKARTVVVSMKPSLIKAAKESRIPAYFKDIKVDDGTIYGYVKSVTNMGLFVSFGGKLTGLVLAKYATDKPDADLSKIFYKYQSVSCRVIRIDDENKRFLLSLKENKRKEESSSEELVNPVDKQMKTVGDYNVGICTKATIKSIKGTQLNVQLADNLQGRIHITQCFNSWSEIKDPAQPLSKFHKNDVVDVKVIGYHDVKNHSYLPITHRKANKTTILELSMLENELKSNGEVSDPLSLRDVQIGSEWLVYINNVAKGYVWVSLTPNIRGRIPFMELSDDASIFEDLDNKLPIGKAIKATVKEIENEYNTATLSSRTTKVKSINDVTIGQKYPARILKVKDTFVLVELGEKVFASSFITDALDNYSHKLENVFHANDYTSATVLAVDKDTEKIAVSLRTSSATDKCINSISDLSVGDVVKGYVKNVANNGVYVALGRSIHALVRVSDLSDSFLKDWKKFFKPHQLVMGKISSCKEEGRILMTLKESEVNGDLNLLKKFDDLEVNDIFEGSVKRITDFGVFVKLDGTVNISGLCHHSEIANKEITDIKSLFGEGDRVKVKILSINAEKKQLSLGMKASYFTSEDDENDDVDMNDAEDIEDEESDAKSDQEDDDENDVMMDIDYNAEDNSDDESEQEDEETSRSKQSGLSTNGFDWTASILDQAEDDYSSSDEEDFTQDKKKQKKGKKYIEDKTADLNTRAPQSVADFERLLIGNPDSSIMWMNYMSFQLQLSEIDKAREIGERALKTINYREEQEKMNIWIALLNLENSFGTDETLDETFKRSCQYMDSLTMHQKLIGIYTLSEKFDNATNLFKTMTKKFGKHVVIWVQYGSYLLDRQLQEETHEVLAKALQVLPKNEHIEVVKKFAQLEFNKGDPEQGRSLFEGLVSDAPKRIDLWNIYIDQEIKQGSKDKVENLFERVLAKKISRKQAKFFFSKWLSFEEEHGTEQGAARVKAKAAEYVQAHQNEN